jgi:predicted Zn-dependent protease
VNAEYFDGRSARPHPVRLRLHGGALHIAGDGVALQVPAAQVDWPERQRHGPRVAHLPDGGSLHCSDGPAWDAWLRAAGQGEPLVVRLQQSWRATLAAVLALLLLGATAYLWGLPLAARGVVALLPWELDQRIGAAALESLRERRLLLPSTRPVEQQARIRSAFDHALAQACAGQHCPAHTLHFQQGGRLGANALALPGGAIVITDELLVLLDGQDAVVLGVLAHEYGHVRQRHGLRALVQLSLLGAATGLAFGDFSNLLAGLPALLGQLGYARDAEREADDESIRVLRANGISPDVMLLLFERLAGQRRRPGPGDGAEPGIALASHPADAERMQRFRAAAAR